MKNLEIYDFNKTLVDTINESKESYNANYHSLMQIFLIFEILLFLNVLSISIVLIAFKQLVLSHFFSFLVIPVLAPFIIKANKKKEKKKVMLKKHLIDKKLENISFVLKKENVYTNTNSLQNASVQLIDLKRKDGIKKSEYNILFFDNENKIRILKEISEKFKNGIEDSKLYLLADEEVKKEIEGIQLIKK